MSMQNRGVSPIIGYVLLIVLALAMAGGVYSYLKLYLPSTEPECPDAVSLIMDAITCSEHSVQLTLINRGYFTVDGAYIRIGEINRSGKYLLNCPSDPSSTSCRLYFSQEYIGNTTYEQGLKPGDIWSPKEPYEYTGYALGEGEMREIEIQPIVFVDNKQVLCQKAIVTEQVVCL